jgi:hypothetical protein
MTDALQKYDDSPEGKPEPDITEEQALAALKELDVGQKLSVTRAKAEAVFGKYLSVGGISAPLLTTAFTSVRVIEDCATYAMEEAKKDGALPEDKARFLQVVVMATKALPQLIEQMQELERKIRKPAKPKDGKNAPPVFVPQPSQVVVHGDNVHIHEAAPSGPKPQEQANPAGILPARSS